MAVRRLSGLLTGAPTARAPLPLRPAPRALLSGAAERLANKIGRPVSDLQSEARLDFLRAKSLSAEDMLAVAALLAFNPAVEVIDLTGNGFGAEGVESLISILSACPNLRSLAAGNNNLRLGAADLATAAVAHGSLESLALSANAIPAKACESFAAALAAPGARLLALDLSFNAFGPVGGAALARGLASNTTLATLRLASCSVRASGARALAQALGGSAIRVLDLHECHIGADGAAALAEALVSPASVLESLKISDNNIGEMSGLGSSELSADLATEALARALQSPALCSIDFRLNGLNAAQKRRLSEGAAGRARPLKMLLEDVELVLAPTDTTPARSRLTALAAPRGCG